MVFGVARCLATEFSHGAVGRSRLDHGVDRQITSFIDNSIEAGILLGGNGVFTP